MRRPIPKPDSHDAGAARGERAAPIVLRFVGCADEMAGVNDDYFTVGETGDEDVALPPTLRPGKDTKLRFSRGAEGWRVSLAGDRPFYINQRRVTGLTDVASGDVVRFTPGGPGMQFTVKQRQDASLAKLAARHAPGLLRPSASEAAPAPKDGETSKAPPAGQFSPSTKLRKAATVAVFVALAVLVGYLIGSLNK